MYFCYYFKIRGKVTKKKRHTQARTSFFYESIVFLSHITYDYRHNRYRHLTRRRVPTQGLDAQFEAEIIDGEVHGDDEDIPEQLSRPVKIRLGKRHVFL